MNIIIDSQRGYVKWPWFQIVYEWEDCLVSNIPNSRLKLISKIDRYIDAFFVKTNFKFQNLFTVWGGQTLHLRYEMSALTHQSFNNRSNVVPIIIDYFLKDEDIPAFDKAHCHNPLVLITSKEAYEHLKQKSQLPLAHWPLSLPDKYKEKEDVKFEKI